MKIIGHSLGGGIAIVLTLLLNIKNYDFMIDNDVRLNTIVYGAPPVLTSGL